jgi:hypothetical protein
MSEARVTIGRLAISLEGLPAATAEHAGATLERSLSDRLAAAAIDPERLRDRDTAALGAIEAPRGVDPAALAALIAERLAAWLASGEER